MPPKKLSKKQLEKQKAELEAQLAAERAKHECAVAAETERLRIIGEEKSGDQAEAEKLRRVDEAHRLKDEDEQFAPFKAHRKTLCKDALAQLVELVDWERYVLDSTLPNPSNEKELNSFMTEWVNMQSKDPAEILRSVDRSAQVIREMSGRMPELKDESKATRVLWYEERIHEMQLENRRRIEEATGFSLQTIESMVDNNKEVKKTIKTSNLSFSVWANLTPGAKFPRMLEFEDAAVSFDLPKLLSRNAFAVRCMHTNFDHVCIEGNMPDHDDKRSIGGVFCCDFLTLPPLERPALHWNMQHQPVDFIKTALLNHTNCPALSNDGAQMELPQAAGLNIKFKMEDHVLMRQPYSVAWWDSHANKWSTEGVENVSFNEVTREVSCESVVFSPLAVVQSKSLDIPYRSWVLSPSGPNQAILTIEMKTHTLRIELGEHTARLLQPDLPELAGVFQKPLPPCSLAAALARSGFTVNPCDADIEHVETLVAKEPSVEQVLHEDLSMLVQGFAFRGSVWNQAAGRNKCTVQCAEKPDFEIDPMNETYQTLIHMWENEAMKIAYLKCDETAAVYKEVFDTTHLRMEQVVQPTMPEQCAAHIKDSNVNFQECVRHMLDAVRLFSFC